MAEQQDYFSWNQFTTIPDAVGFAGSYVGISNNVLIVAGGANFPDGIGPWGKTKKTWYDHVFVLESPNGKWKRAGNLFSARGYGVSLSWNDCVICLGGADGDTHYADVFMLRWKNDRLSMEVLPSFPSPLANSFPCKDSSCILF